MKILYISLISSFVLYFVSCSTTKIHHKLKDTVAYCPPPDSFGQISQEEILPREVILRDSSLLKMYSEKDLLLANAVGVYKLLRKVDSIHKIRQLEIGEVVIIRQEVGMRLLLFNSQISSIAAELDCEGERADQMANYLKDIENKNVKLQTIGSILAGAISGIVTSASQNHSVEKSVGISGGFISAGLGIMALFSEKKIRFMHKRNMLTDVVEENKESKIYPYAIWFILNERLFSNSQKFSICHNIKKRWEKFGYLNNSERDKKLLTGPGGRYTSSLLETRANMLNQMQAAVRQLNQDLEILIARISVNEYLK